MQNLLQERDRANERLAAEADFAFAQLLSSISEQYEGFRDGGEILLLLLKGFS